MAKETRTYKDRARYLAMAVSKRRKHLKVIAVDMAGGKCWICGYKKYTGALEFHHFNEAEKKFGLSVRDLTKNWEDIQKEIHKCALLCANCHREVHAGLINLSQRAIL